MHPYPHLYTVQASARPEGDVPVSSAGLPVLATAPPVEFDGPGDRWSPETLLCAAVADCFLLSFRSVARAQKLAWTSLQCEVQGTLDRVEGKTRFTRIVLKAALVVPEGTDRDKALKAVERAEQVCLISNSLVAERHVEGTVSVG
ncbi:MAG: OsmC family peroxiredoxin [Gammaproteobacteria bacterium]|nr:OsmC family peroxiredoxin [Gammaproteobacteria bacterium]